MACRYKHGDNHSKSCPSKLSFYLDLKKMLKNLEVSKCN
jgi:hypothetical protein